MWHEILEWLPTVTNIVRLLTSVINLSLAVRQLRRRPTED